MRLVISTLLNYQQALVRKPLRSSSSFLTQCFSYSSCILSNYFLTSYTLFYAHRTLTEWIHVRGGSRDPEVSRMELLVTELKDKKPLHLLQQAPP